MWRRFVGSGWVCGRNDKRAPADSFGGSIGNSKGNTKRAGIDEKIIGMDSYRLCVELGGLPEQCKELRRVEADQP
ncbi:hypothetical protein IB60_01935 [Brucella abortus LMN1]|nr:hypothetical protein IB60_01935 [Brucella abortus LMN1]KFH25645.1 hypothetical protein IB61_06190 [Brucella abortus LMN2]